LADFKET